ncbi:MAG: SLC13 family permease [Chloroflexi bacterium]|nr:SLC13 family permease [Chloroflexota bacterium]
MLLAHHLLALFIALSAFVAIIIRPRGISEAVSSLVGAVLMLFIGAISPTDALRTLLANWNLFLFFFGLLSISTVADHAGVFDWLAYIASRLARGNPQRLFLNTFMISVVVTAFLSNDATVLILTPVLVTATSRLGLAARPYVFTCAFVANAASVLLPVSNPANVILLNDDPMALTPYLQHLFLGAVLSIAEIFIILFVLFRSDLRGTFDPDSFQPGTARKDSPLFGPTAAWLVATALIYIAASLREYPLGLVAAASGGGLLLLALTVGRLPVQGALRGVSWQLFGLVAGLLLIVQGLKRAGITELLAKVLLAGDGNSAAFTAVAAGAVGANLINNLPATFVLTAVIQHVPGSQLRDILTLGTIIGVDIGPNITVIGSLSTMLWLLILRKQDLEVTALEYVRLGLPLSLVTLVTSAGLLWLRSR